MNSRERVAAAVRATNATTDTRRDHKSSFRLSSTQLTLHFPTFKKAEKTPNTNLDVLNLVPLKLVDGLLQLPRGPRRIHGGSLQLALGLCGGGMKLSVQPKG